MDIQQQVTLRAHSTMRLGGNAAYLYEISETSEIPQLVNWAEEKKLPVIMIGDGSNIVWRDEGFPGLVLVNKIKGIQHHEANNDTVMISANGGENWDKFVGQTVDMGLSGLELLSLIPGTAGAAPIQNIGAYGCQLSDVLTTIDAYDVQNSEFVTLEADNCEFGYRTSRFKTTDRNRFLIFKINLLLSKKPVKRDMYHSLENYLKEHGIEERNPQAIRTAVSNLRNEKLPNPAIVANCGSFFANPIIETGHLNQILDKFPDLKTWHSKFTWEQPDGRIKVAAGALMEHSGFKDYQDTETGMATWNKQALVLVNEHAKSTADLLKFKQKITDTIQQKFNITLEQEPELLPINPS